MFIPLPRPHQACPRFLEWGTPAYKISPILRGSHNSHSADWGRNGAECPPVRGHPRIVTIGDGAAGGTVACFCAPASQVAQDGLWMRPGNGWFAGECLAARVVAWLVAAWRRRQT